MKKSYRYLLLLGFTGLWAGALSAAGISFPDGSVQRQSAIAENVIIVTVGDSIADALNVTSDATATNQYLVSIGPGVFNEGNDLLHVRPYVHLQGSGKNVTRVTSTRRATGFSLTPMSALELHANGMVSDLTLDNIATGSGNAYGILTSEDGGVIQDAHIKSTGGGANGGNTAVYSNNADVIIKGSMLTAYGRTGFESAVNAALFVLGASSGGFAQPIISDSDLFGGSTVNPSMSQRRSCAGSGGTGFGVFTTYSAPEVYRSNICGEYRAIESDIAGGHRVHYSRIVSSAASSGDHALLKTTGSGSILFFYSQLLYFDLTAASSTGNTPVCVLSTDGGVSQLNSSCN